MKKESLNYHKQEPSGKLEIQPTKKIDSDWDLSLAYSPGVAYPCEEIKKDSTKVFDYTGKGNLIAVISNGTAVLGLGSIGPLASKPVMEGKAVLFKKFAGINVFDIELKTQNIEEFINVCKNLEPTFGGINLEDISSPSCFEIEKRLIEELNIPVFHDDQHGTAIITAAALINACHIQKKDIGKIKIVFNGAGAAAIACADLILSLGVKKSNISICDSKGLIYKGRKEGMNSYKEKWAIESEKRSLADVLKNTDVFIGLSVKDVLTPDMIKTMNKKPIVFAMANPNPEIDPIIAKKEIPDIIMATGRSDFPNQVNNILGFPFVFRGALDVRAKRINKEMKIAAAKALTELARTNVPDKVSKAYKEDDFQFGPEYIIPKPFDERVLIKVAPAVAKAAMDTGVAQKPIEDFEEYINQLESFQSQSKGFIRRVIKQVKIFNKKTKIPKIIYAEGESEKILKALNVLILEKVLEPILVGDKNSIHKSIESLRLDNLKEISIISPENHPQFEYYVKDFYEMRKSKGMSLKEARGLMKQINYFSAMYVKQTKDVALITGATDSFANSIVPILRIINTGKRNTVAGVNLVLLKNKILFFADTSFNISPSVEEIANIAVYTAKMAKYFHIEPRIAFLSYTNFSDGSVESPKKMKEASLLIKKWFPDLKVEGGIQADIAVNESIAKEIFPNFSYSDGANILIFPNLDSGNMAYKLAQQLGSGDVLGPFLMGISKPVNILQRTCSIDDIMNTSVMTALKVHSYQDLQ